MRKKHRMLGIHEKVYSFAVKCYDEQMPYGSSYTMNQIRTLDKNIFQILAICHNRDEITQGIWAIALEKPHYHIIIRCSNSKFRERISAILNQLGIFFRPVVDDSLLQNHGLETVNNFQAYSMYLTHETEDAVKDGKELYDITEIVSNLTLDEIKCIRDGYQRVADATTKPTMSKLAELDKEAFELGYNLKNYEKWYSALAFSIRSQAKIKTIAESYQRGVEQRINENQEIVRLCIYIKGEPNTGKTFAAKQALNGKNYLSIGGGGTGKFDRLRADHDAIIIDDDVCPNLLNMTDNYICRAYKRNSNNPAWAGRYFVVTSNLPFNVWLKKSGIRVADQYGMSSQHYEAMLSRFYICVIAKNANGKNQLACIRTSERGSLIAQQERLAMFTEFRDKFNQTIANYTPTTQQLDYQNILDIEIAGCQAVEAL